MSNSPYLSLIIPAYNEESRLGASLQSVLDFLEKDDKSYEVLVVDDGSKDDTVKIAQSYGDKVKVLVQDKNQGKGAAVRRGMLAANGKVQVFTDADLSTPIYELKKIYEHINCGFDVVLGSRALDNEMIKVHQPFYRELMGKTFNRIVQTLVVKGIKDTQCGFKGFTAKASHHVFSKVLIDGFGFDVEIVYLAKRLGYKIVEIPVEWYNDERSKVDPIRDSTKMLLEILKIRKLHRND